MLARRHADWLGPPQAAHLRHTLRELTDVNELLTRMRDRAQVRSFEAHRAALPRPHTLVATTDLGRVGTTDPVCVVSGTGCWASCWRHTDESESTDDEGRLGASRPMAQVAELNDALPSGRWTPVGGLMTQLHTIHHGMGIVRPTNDVDIVLQTASITSSTPPHRSPAPTTRSPSGRRSRARTAVVSPPSPPT